MSEPEVKQHDPAAVRLTGDKEEALVAYRIPNYPSYLTIIPAPVSRHWMDVGTHGWANRCLPLRIANQAGWMILNDTDFEVVWGGGEQLDNLKIVFPGGKKSRFVTSMFGYGVVTWIIPYLFRTAPGFNLLVRGPVNSFKDGIAPLEGIVETDWLPYTFTMNWRLTRRLKGVQFKRDEPFCMITPIRRGDLESMNPEIQNLDSRPDLLERYQVWHRSRKEAQKILTTLPHNESFTAARQGHYQRGEGLVGERAEEHQTRLSLKPFTEIDPPKIVTPNTEPPANTVESKGFFRRLLRS